MELKWTHLYSLGGFFWELNIARAPASVLATPFSSFLDIVKGVLVALLNLKLSYSSCKRSTLTLTFWSAVEVLPEVEFPALLFLRPTLLITGLAWRLLSLDEYILFCLLLSLFLFWEGVLVGVGRDRDSLLRIAIRFLSKAGSLALEELLLFFDRVGAVRMVLVEDDFFRWKAGLLSGTTCTSLVFFSFRFRGDESNKFRCLFSGKMQCIAFKASKAVFLTSLFCFEGSE